MFQNSQNLQENSPITTFYLFLICIFDQKLLYLHNINTKTILNDAIDIG